ncbi:MAG: YggT family protein [Deltaproteobacteria bacterium]|nr:MAG: YggT family protein [Deltaproteobacteria bacterium]
MFILGNFLYALAKVINILLTFFMILIIARAVISWVNPDPFNPIVRFLYRWTEPILWRIRRYLPVAFGLDLSPLVALLIIYFLKVFLVSTLLEVAHRLRF